jgi:hypothetical protein
MSYLSKLHSGAKKVGLMHELVETGELVGGVAAFGYLQNRYREKASLWGVPADLAAGAVLKVAVLGCKYFGKFKRVCPHLDNLGNAGLAAYAHTLGAGYGAQASGVKRLLISEADVAKAKAALPNATILGDIPKAPHGDYFSSRDLADMAK